MANEEVKTADSPESFWVFNLAISTMSRRPEPSTVTRCRYLPKQPHYARPIDEEEKMEATYAGGFRNLFWRPKIHIYVWFMSWTQFAAHVKIAPQ